MFHDKDADVLIKDEVLLGGSLLLPKMSLEPSSHKRKRSRSHYSKTEFQWRQSRATNSMDEKSVKWIEAVVGYTPGYAGTPTNLQIVLNTQNIQLVPQSWPVNLYFLPLGIPSLDYRLNRSNQRCQSFLNGVGSSCGYSESRTRCNRSIILVWHAFTVLPGFPKACSDLRILHPGQRLGRTITKKINVLLVKLQSNNEHVHRIYWHLS